MSTSVQSPSVNSSVTSSHSDSFQDMAVVNVMKHIKDMLRSKIFLGRYLERRLVDERIGYRDIILISAAETEIQRNFNEALQRLRSVYPNIHWIGITDSSLVNINVSSSMCLWTEIDNQPFGPFWFQIKGIKLRDNEILITVSCIRSITDAYLELEPILTGAVKAKNENDRQLVSTSVNESVSCIKETLKSAFSIKNLKDFVTFLCAFVIAIFTGSTTFVNFLGNFILALLREISILIKNSTPMFLGILDFLSKIVGGFYILVSMLFKPNTPAPQNRRALSYYEGTDSFVRKKNPIYKNQNFD